MHGMAMAVAAVLLSGRALLAQGGLPGLPPGTPGLSRGAAPSGAAPDGALGGSGAEFCRRVGSAALSCRSGGVALTDPAGLVACLARSLPMADSMRLAQAAQRLQGNPMSVLTECGIR